MSLIHATRPVRLALSGLGVALAALAVVVLGDPTPAHAALRSAAGGGSSGSGGFAALGNFFDHLTTYAIWLAVPVCGLAVVAGGLMLVSGSPKATRVLSMTAIGFAIVVSAKGLVA
jgi:hypothetical protein